MRKVLLFVLILLVVWFFIRFVIGGSEDSWICVEREWVKHGYPNAPKPEGSCGSFRD